MSLVSYIKILYHTCLSPVFQVNIYPQAGTDEITLSLTIRKLEPADFGKYNCIASNVLGESNKKMTLAGEIGCVW